MAIKNKMIYEYGGYMCDEDADDAARRLVKRLCGVTTQSQHGDKGVGGTHGFCLSPGWNLFWCKAKSGILESVIKNFLSRLSLRLFKTST
jgi:hypothetical protein